MSKSILKEFERWFGQNRDKFTCNKPYIYKDRTKNKGKGKKYLELRFENIIPWIYVYVSKDQINVWVNLEKIVGPNRNDLLADYLVAEKRNKEGRYCNSLFIEPKYYDTIEEVYDEEFNCFLEWANLTMKEDNFLAITWNGGITSARVIDPVTQPKEYESYKTSSGKTGFSPTGNEFLLSQLVNVKGKKMVSPSRENKWHSKLLKLSSK